jgi:hypothetical protein
MALQPCEEPILDFSLEALPGLASSGIAGGWRFRRKSGFLEIHADVCDGLVRPFEGTVNLGDVHALPVPAGFLDPAPPAPSVDPILIDVPDVDVDARQSALRKAGCRQFRVAVGAWFLHGDRRQVAEGCDVLPDGIVERGFGLGPGTGVYRREPAGIPVLVVMDRADR